MFLYPWVLLLLTILPLLAIWFLFEQRGYFRNAFEFSQVALFKHLARHRNTVLHQRIMPFAILLSLAFGILGLAQPVWKTLVATHKSYIILALDISISMEAKDIAPNRLEAAKKAAIDFVKKLPGETRLGLVFFAGNNYLVSHPIDDHKMIIGYLESLTTSDLRPGTAMGDALIVATESIQQAIQQQESSSSKKYSQQRKQVKGNVILLTDGENNLGISPIVAADDAYRKNITVFTIGIGEDVGAYVRGGIFTHLDETTLEAIARQTGGLYYRARSLKDFEDIYNKIAQKTLSYEEKMVSLMPWCIFASSMLMLFVFTWGIRYRRF